MSPGDSRPGPEYTSCVDVRTILEILWFLAGVTRAVRAGLGKNEVGFVFAFLFFVVGIFVFLQPVSCRGIRNGIAARIPWK
jgi:hypothetical protein